jgi:hypothetical protein
MTQEEAQIIADAYNATLVAATITDQEFLLTENFTPNYQSAWEIMLIPDIYAVLYGAATAAQLAGFGRVYQLTIGEAAAGATYLTQFDINAANDSVLGPYLGL